ncbi:MAG TPA: hypothetical protein VL484_20360 [Vicinamibacterales bacterium]|jgi:hypothetical protein|nr:hypothetical protein [Vicinamibacterales bacterium]
MKTPLAAALSAILLSVAAMPATAQTSAPRTQPPVQHPLPRPKPKPKLSNKLAVRAEGLVGIERFTASETFKGIFDSPKGAIFGGGVDVVKGHWFVRGDVTHFGKTGQRAFDLNGQVFRLGIPLKVSITPVYGAAGFRGLVGAKWVAYAGGGVGSWSYSESGDDPADALSLRKTGYLGLGGVEWRVHPVVGIGFEAQYAAVPNAFDGGLAADLGEKDMGGATAAVRVIVGRW